MNPLTSTCSDQVEQTGLFLRQVLLRLDQYAKNRIKLLDISAPHAAATMNHVRDLDELMIAVQGYEEAVLFYLPVSTTETSIGHLSNSELLALREADPVYRLGYMRGLRRAKELLLSMEQPRQQMAPPVAVTGPKLTTRTVREALIQRVRGHLLQLSRNTVYQPHHGNV